MTKPKIYTMSFASIYPHLIKKVEKKGRTKEEVDEVIHWMTGYSHTQINQLIKDGTDYETFINQSPKLNPNRTKVTGVICGIRIEEMENSIMKEIRYLDKMIDELAKGKSLNKIFRNDV
ncbi:DUF2200 domain-containing protein [Staphylococcus xylosus]|uniref:DUF2200 domain-containing protein n=1 Tax=Staphylococcus pseudoxylosus TaxID=2282419 RepID=UPI000D1D1A84|nr:DUF2200 domain-containing protein [Staphylococcus pseudoxylosus]MEB6046331.1 DUF2200 domain-containing protein [Staphylococcus pseudoxylosus]MEB8010129.1 DUF2200 domain-containing protein [Staphylococcus pseudoxylosus]PTI44926.1 DUF2200 domain-containing protein [Staphylococcus xylosus]